MSAYEFTLSSAKLCALPNGVLWWPDRRLLCVSDLHLGKSDRIARRGGTLLPPYETRETLERLAASVTALDPLTVICLGDSFDDLAALDALSEADHKLLSTLMAGRRWVWIEGNHDPGPLAIGGSHLASFSTGPLTFRHIADPAETAEVSGHYHPKARIASTTKPCFLLDKNRLILSAFGAYTGGLRTTSDALTTLMQKGALAILTGNKALPVPMPRK